MKKIIALSALLFSIGIAPIYANCGENHHGARIEKLMSQLNLTPDQKKQIDTINDQTKQSVKPEREKLHDLHKQIKEAYKDNTMDDSKIDGYVNQEKEIIGNILKLRMTQRLQISKILTAEQRAKLDSLETQWRAEFKEKIKELKKSEQVDDDNGSDD